MNTPVSDIINWLTMNSKVIETKQGESLIVVNYFDAAEKFYQWLVAEKKFNQNG